VWKATRDEQLDGRITNSIRPVAAASLRVKGEAQDATVPEGMQGDLRGKLWRTNQSILQGQREVVGGRTTGRFSAVSRDRLVRTDAAFMLKKPKNRTGQNDRAPVVAKKRVTIVEPRGAGR
jgi:hypothetical protein